MTQFLLTRAHTVQGVRCRQGTAPKADFDNAIGDLGMERLIQWSLRRPGWKERLSSIMVGLICILSCKQQHFIY